MELYQPIQRTTDKRWDMTLTNSRGIHPIGYCTNKPAWTEELGRLLNYTQEQFDAQRHGDLEKYHQDGHPTPDESSQCYRQYRLDVRLRFWEESDTQRKCKECQGWTTGRAECGWEVIPLCPSHQTLEIAARHM